MFSITALTLAHSRLNGYLHVFERRRREAARHGVNRLSRFPVFQRAGDVVRGLRLLVICAVC